MNFISSLQEFEYQYDFIIVIAMIECFQSDFVTQ